MAYLRAFGSWLPRRRVSNEEIAPRVDATPEWILEVSGIAERRYADDSDTVAGIGLLAARDCLEKAGVTAADLGMILVASGSSDRFCPGPACQIASGLGLSTTPALDIPVSSAGSLIGFAHIADSCLFTDGASAETLFVQDGKFSMDGQAVIMQASRKMPRAINQLLARNQISAAEVEVFLLHQANLNLITRVAATLKAPPERFYTNIDRYANTSSASLLIAADEWYAKQTAPISGPLVFSAFGSGLNWGALLAVPIRDMQATS